MKSSRQKKILEIINRYHVETQDDLIDRLLVEGFSVTQATVSRDIRELQLSKVLTDKGTYRYVLPRKEEAVNGVKINEALVDSITGADHAQNLVVVRTFPGLAQAVAAGIDSLAIADVLGCVAGDDTILIAARSEAAAKTISERIRVMMRMS